ncbi:MAG: flagellar assembly protein FliH [Aquabacterium sp.]|nr:flagellar assembly protein FliH [Aquabacterium sp.]
MNSSRRDPRRENLARQVPPPANSRGGVPYTRFIPREELQDFSAWMPDAFGGAASFAQPVQPGSPMAQVWAAAEGEQPAGPPAPPWPDAAGFASAAAPATAASEVEITLDAQPTLAELHADLQAEMAVQVAAARQQGYQDGYRDGLVALDSFKESFALQVSGQLTQVLASLDRELNQLEQQLAAGVARVATELARQVVRSELVHRPALVVQVAQEAVDAVLMSARHITVQVHPDDHALVAQGCDEALAARGARLVSLPSMARGGCRVESDAGVIDARVPTRWAQAILSLGTGVAWEDDERDGPVEGDDA